MSEVPVVRIKSSHPPSQGEFVEINETDFDAEKHELYEAKPKLTLPPPPVARK